MKKFLIGSIGGVLLLLCVRAATVAIAPLNIAFMRFLGVSDSLAPVISGTILFVGYAFAVLGPIFSGWLVDRIGMRLAVFLGGALFTAAYFLWAYAASYPFLYFFRAALALGSSAVAVGMMSYLHATAPGGKKGASMGLYGLGFGLGSAAGPMVAARLVPMGIREPFFFFSSACLVSLGISGVLMLVVRREKTEKPIVPAGSERKLSLKSLKRFDKSLFFLFLLSLFFMFGQIALLTTTDDFGVRVFGLEAGRGIMAVVAFSVASLLQPLGGMVGDRIGKARAVVIGVGLTTACFLGVAINTFSFPLQLVLMALAGIGGVLYMPNVMALVGDLSPADLKGTGMGFFQASAGLGSALGALAAGFIYSAISVQAAFWQAPLGLALGFLFTLLAAARIKQTQPAGPAVETVREG